MEGKGFIEKIELLGAIAHPVRVRILEELTNGVKCVSDIEEFLGISQPNVSQHLSLLRRYGVIDYYVDGRLRCYFLVNPMIPDILEVLKKEYAEDLPAPACCPVTRKGKYPGKEARPPSDERPVRPPAGKDPVRNRKERYA